MKPADVVLNRLPDYMRAADKRGKLRGWFGGAAEAFLGPASSWVNANDPDTAPTGRPLWADPMGAPREPGRDVLGWLALLIGVDVHGIPPVDVRPYVADAGSRRRGTTALIVSNVRRSLTGTRWVRVVPAPGGDPWGLQVDVWDAECPNRSLTERYARRDKPAGVRLVMRFLVGATYEDLSRKYKLYDDMTSTRLTYAELASSAPDREVEDSV